MAAELQERNEKLKVERDRRPRKGRTIGRGHRLSTPSRPLSACASKAKGCFSPSPNSSLFRQSRRITLSQDWTIRSGRHAGALERGVAGTRVLEWTCMECLICQPSPLTTTPLVFASETPRQLPRLRGESQTAQLVLDFACRSLRNARLLGPAKRHLRDAPHPIHQHLLALFGSIWHNLPSAAPG
jgi:hypothetical protein